MRKVNYISLVISLSLSLVIAVDSEAIANSGPEYLCRVYSKPETETSRQLKFIIGIHF